jgi:Arc/MetJ-type ribon-helix-helix transcriptional regulator
MLKEPRVTVKIPRPLYRRIQVVIENSGFSSPTDFIVFVLRDLVSEVEKKHAVAAPASDQEFTPEEVQAVRQKLKNLGYL